MQYVRLGTTGLKVSRVCLGTMTFGTPKWRNWVLDEAQSLPIVARAWECGINFFDTADMYSVGESEVVLGSCLRQLGVPRDRVVIATKVHNAMGTDPNQRGQSRKHIRHAIDDSLRRLKMDYVDLYQIHRYDPETPMEEVVDALDQVVRAGKALYVGASSMYAWQFQRFLYLQKSAGAARFVTMQNHYNLVYREEEREMNPLCVAEGIGLIPWSPLARGFLTGNRASGTSGQTVRAQNDGFAKSMYHTPDDYAVLDAVGSVAKARGIGLAEVALAWVMAQPGVSAPIVGASRLEHVDAAIRALDVRLSADELSALAHPYRPHAILGM